MSARSNIAKHVARDGVKSRRHQRRFTEELFGEMPRYFFHIKRGQVTVLDQDGIELPSLEDAAKEAMRRGQELASKASAQGTSGTRRMIIIADSEWRTMIEVPF
jgi:hypothetical protein